MADLRPQYSEEAIGANHPTKADIINRAYNVEHEEDGTHELIGNNALEFTTNGIIHMAKQSGFSAYLSADQDIVKLTLTTMEFDTEEDDIQGEFNTGTYTFTAAKAGKYQVSLVNVYGESLVTTKIMVGQIYKNGGIYTAVRMLGTGVNTGHSISVRMPLAANDTILVKTYHDGADNRQLSSAYCRFSIAKVA